VADEDARSFDHSLVLIARDELEAVLRIIEGEDALDADEGVRSLVVRGLAVLGERGAEVHPRLLAMLAVAMAPEATARIGYDGLHGRGVVDVHDRFGRQVSMRSIAPDLVVLAAHDRDVRPALAREALARAHGQVEATFGLDAASIMSGQIASVRATSTTDGWRTESGETVSANEFEEQIVDLLGAR